MARIVIVGAGAIGLLLAARCRLAGLDVELLVRRREQAERIRSAGVQLKEAAGAAAGEQHARLPVRLLSEAARAAEMDGDSAPRQAGYIVLAVKQTAIGAELARQIGCLAGAGGLVVCLQNGIGHIDALEAFIPRERLLMAVTTEGALRLSDCAVAHTGRGTTWIGTAGEGGAEAARRQKKLQEMLNLAGFDVFVSNNINNRVWQKLLINAVVNPLTAIFGVKNGELLKRPEWLPLMRELFAEGAEVARLEGIRLPDDAWEQVLDVCRRTAGNRSSMLQDLMAGRPTEIEAINGGLLALASRHGIELPANQAVYRLVKAMEQRPDA